RRPAARPELVRAWLGPGREPAGPPSRRWGWVGPTLAPALAAAVGAALLLVLGVAFAAALTAARWRRTAEPAAQALEHVARATAWDDANAALRRVAWLPAATRAQAAAAARWPAADSAAGLLLGGQASRDVLASPRVAWWSPDGGAALAAARRVLADTAVGPLLAAWRGVARLRRPPELWHETEEGAVPVRLSEEGTRALARLNDAAGLVAAAEGDASATRQRAQENLAVGRWLLADPVNGHLAAGVLALGGAMLFDRGVLAGDPAVLARAERLRAALPPDDGLTDTERRQGAALLMASPAAPTGLPTIADTAALPYVRAALIGGVADGFCSSGRELAMGVDRGRLALLARVDSLAQDLRHADRLAARTAARIETWAASTPPPGNRVPRRGLLRVLGWVGLGGVADRLGFCRGEVG
ncbi:MAG: hypothetical protein GTN78_21460, partial [Gemmatimonadales bacterium]|nr:hypothetical protein [Gemmatimonadales bacterium]